MLKPLLAGYEGFVRAESFASLSEDGKILSMNVWTDKTAVERWRNDVQHRLCQKEGRESLFASYRITLSSRDVFTTTGLIQLRICTSIHTYLSVNIV